MRKMFKVENSYGQTIGEYKSYREASTVAGMQSRVNPNEQYTILEPLGCFKNGGQYDYAIE